MSDNCLACGKIHPLGVPVCADVVSHSEEKQPVSLGTCKLSNGLHEKNSICQNWQPKEGTA